MRLSTRSVRQSDDKAPVGGCEHPDCLRLAEFTIHAQWSWADFVEYEACLSHLGEMLEQLSEHQVDGNLPLELTAAWHELPSWRTEPSERGTAGEGGVA
jgi:hypothetical protein